MLWAFWSGFSSKTKINYVNPQVPKRDCFGAITTGYLNDENPIKETQEELESLFSKCDLLLVLGEQFATVVDVALMEQINFSLVVLALVQLKYPTMVQFGLIHLKTNNQIPQSITNHCLGRRAS